MELAYFLLIGVCAGWLAGQFTKSGSGDLVTNLIMGVVGAIIGGFLFRVLGFTATSLLGQLITATGGACVLIAGLRAVKK